MQGVTFTYKVDGNDYQKAGEASRSAKFTLKRLGLPPEIVRRVGVCMYEGEINMVIHADGGTATLTVGIDEIVIELRDKGPGISNIELAMQAGWSTADSQATQLGFGAGMGLPNMKRYSDEMEIDTRVGEGTTVRMVIKF
ncbi:MAG: ATP-binding protein [Clostridia bacterium]|nr:ATP-binding protein [Clostridia bacterium]